MINNTDNRVFQIMLIITHSCNLNCIYCYEKKRDYATTDKEKLKVIIAEYLNSDKYDEIIIEFFGGEPWLKKKLIIEICEWTWSKEWKNKYRFFTSTNGTLIHNELQDWLHKHNKQFSCGLSLDGKPFTHNYNRNNSYEKIDIDFFLTNWPNQPVKMTIDPSSLASLADNVIYIHRLGFTLAGTNFAEGLDWSKNEYIRILSHELNKLVKFYLNNPEIPVAPILNIPIEMCEYERMRIPNKYCAVRSLMAFDVDGQAYPCNFITPMTFTHEQLNKLSMSDFYDDNNLIDDYCYHNCYFYSICPNCYGANFLVNGKISERDKTKCNLIKIQSYYASALHAQKIIQNKKSDWDKSVISSRIKAINKIKELCECEFKDI